MPETDTQIRAARMTLTARLGDCAVFGAEGSEKLHAESLSEILRLEALVRKAVYDGYVEGAMSYEDEWTITDIELHADVHANKWLEANNAKPV
jgi:hypothetical protein